MADKKKNAGQGQSQMVAPRSASGEKEQSKSAKADSRGRKEREPRRETKGAPAWQLRLRNNRIVRFLLEAFYELRHKVTWPTFNEARNMTVVVVILSAVVGLVLWLADRGFYQLFYLITHINGG